MGNLGVSAGTATSWLGLNVEPAGRPSPVLPQDAWSWKETALEDGPLGTRVTSDCPFCLSPPFPVFTMEPHQRLHHGILDGFWLEVKALKVEQP